MNQKDTPMSAGESNSHFVTLRHASLVTLTLAACWIVSAPVIYLTQGSANLAAAAVAALICVLAAISAAVVGSVMFKRGNPLASTLAPMLIRMALPLVICLIVEYPRRTPLAEHGMSLYLVGFYLVALAADTFLSVGRIQTRSAASKES